MHLFPSDIYDCFLSFIQWTSCVDWCLRNQVQSQNNSIVVNLVAAKINLTHEALYIVKGHAACQKFRQDLNRGSSWIPIQMRFFWHHHSVYISSLTFCHSEHCLSVAIPKSDCHGFSHMPSFFISFIYNSLLYSVSAVKTNVDLLSLCLLGAVDEEEVSDTLQNGSILGTQQFH